MNERATGLVSASGGSVTVVGDAFVARAYDNEAEDMVRYTCVCVYIWHIHIHV